MPGVQVGHSIAGVGRQVPGQKHTAAHELVVCQVISPVAGAHTTGFHLGMVGLAQNLAAR